jgi:malonyl-CoA O-methyltransferase
MYNLKRMTRHWLGRLRNRLTKTLTSRSAYRLWAANYPPYPHNALMEIEQIAMLRLLPDLKDKTVLDLGCGSGRYGLIAQQRGASAVIGVDDSQAMLHAGVSAGVRFPLVEASMISLPFTEKQFSVVICGLALGHLNSSDLHCTFRELHRVLVTNGTLLFSDFHPSLYARGGRRTFTAPNGNQYHVEHYPHTLNDYRCAVEDVGFTITAVDEPYATSNIAAVIVIACRVN